MLLKEIANQWWDVMTSTVDDVILKQNNCFDWVLVRVINQDEILYYLIYFLTLIQFQNCLIITKYHGFIYLLSSLIFYIYVMQLTIILAKQYLHAALYEDCKLNNYVIRVYTFPNECHQWVIELWRAPFHLVFGNEACWMCSRAAVSFSEEGLYVRRILHWKLNRKAD